jgi:hypothetical protein
MFAHKDGKQGTWDEALAMLLVKYPIHIEIDALIHIEIDALTVNQTVPSTCSNIFKHIPRKLGQEQQPSRTLLVPPKG